MVKDEGQLLSTLDEIALADVRREDGWRGLQIRFFGAELTGSSSACLFHAEFPPGAAHEAHVHPNADEYYFIVSGSAVAGTATGEHPVGAGSVHFVPAGSPHWLRNDDAHTPVVVVGVYTGVGSLEEAGYERVDVASPSGS
jgi:mannose-6-phosphate isomerase-like protein (cupin superfamily)